MDSLKGKLNTKNIDKNIEDFKMHIEELLKLKAIRESLL
jgi:hypothetical protein